MTQFFPIDEPMCIFDSRVKDWSGGEASAKHRRRVRRRSHGKPDRAKHGNARKFSIFHFQFSIFDLLGTELAVFIVKIALFKEICHEI